MAMHKALLYCLWGLLLIGSVLLVSYTVKNDIVLKNDPLPVEPDGFYINGVTDDRVVKGTVATVVVGAKNSKPELQEADLQGGVANGVNRFLSLNLKKDTLARAINISIKDFKLTETVLTNGGIDGRIQLTMSFGQPKAYGIQQLIEYRGGLHYTRWPGSDEVVEAQLRNAIKSALLYFNNWMRINNNDNPKLAKEIAFKFADYTGETESDTIYYSVARRLSWTDFQSRVRPPGPFSAMIIPGFGYNITQDVKNGTINVHMAMKTYVAKSDSWVGGVRDAYGLNHEQRHFDIARIITRRYQKKIIEARLTPDTYEAFINMQYFESYRDMNAMQKAYDKETQHGINQQVQQAWNKKIESMLAE